MANRNCFSKNSNRNYNCNPVQDITKSAALITGSSSGIGETFARRLSQKGYRLLLVARRQKRLEKLAAELGDAEPLVADLTDDADLLAVEGGFQTINSKFPSKSWQIRAFVLAWL
jgi:short-subunit dehydrogenase